MIPVTQDGDNCWAACVASILELPLEEVPTYSQDDDFLPRWQEFLLARNLFSMTMTFDHSWRSVPPGWSVLLLRVAEGTPLSCELGEGHALVCRNGRPVWDPNGYRLPLDWNGWIEERCWQVVDPVAWVVFVTPEPVRPSGAPIPADAPESFDAMVAEAVSLLKILRDRRPQPRPGVDYHRLFNRFDKILAAYCEAPTDEVGEQRMIQAVRQLKAAHVEERLSHPGNARPL